MCPSDCTGNHRSVDPAGLGLRTTCLFQSAGIKGLHHHTRLQGEVTKKKKYMIIFSVVFFFPLSQTGVNGREDEFIQATRNDVFQHSSVLNTNSGRDK